MKRIIFLVDMNAFFISCEMSRNKSLKGKPAAVAGDPKYRSGIILAPNYEARKYNIKTTMLVHEAKKLCPDLILVPPDHKFYSQKSREVMGILSRYTPVIQQNSIDEAWLDLTGCTLLFGSPREIAENIMKTLMVELDLWCSIGISENKFLAKMASERKKPLGITEIWVSDIKEKIWPLPVREMYGIGKQTEKKLVEMGLFTIGDIAACDQNILYEALGKYGIELKRLANGIDTSPVEASPVQDSKSISRSETLARDITDLEEAKVVLMELAEEVGIQAREQNFKGKTVSITIRYSDFKTVTRQKTVKPTFLTKEIYKAGEKLLEENWNDKKPVRLLGIGLSSNITDKFTQLNLFDIIESAPEGKKQEKLELAMDSIRKRFGMDVIKRAKILKDNDD
ncbi:MAG TPA: DNA polymerase IV [Clostridiaceae bacterium]|nr:DNA polymerase IV [Clostridiaceae bacterium]